LEKETVFSLIFFRDARRIGGRPKMDTTLETVLEQEVIASDRTISDIRARILDLRSTYLASSGDGRQLIVGISAEEYREREMALLKELEIAGPRFAAALKAWGEARG
jgi:ethanolamine utilization cobalamin adenosyltransferase